MRVLFVSTGDETTGSTRLRILDAQPDLKKENIEATNFCYGPWTRRSPLPVRITWLFLALPALFRAPFYDAVYVHRALFPLGLAWVLSLVTDTLVFDYDDAIYAPRPWEEKSLGLRLWRPIERWQTGEILSSSDVVVAGSPGLAEHARKYANTVYTLPTPLSRDKYERARQKRAARTDNGVTIGWIGYADNLRYLADVEDALANILDSHENVDLAVISDEQRPVTPLGDRRGDDVTYYTWSMESELDDLSRFDIGIRPLRTDEWSSNKGGFTSVVQCMALRIPVVVTPVGLLREFVTDGESGYYASTPNEWESMLSELIENSDKRTAMGESAYEALEHEGLWLDQYTAKISELLSIRVDD